MSFSPTDQIRGCRSLQELERVWTANVKMWSQLPVEEAREVIRAKDAHKAELLFQMDVDKAVRRINQAWESSGTVMDDIPQEARDKALELEARITDAANGGDVSGFKDALRKWCQCWMRGRA